MPFWPGLCTLTLLTTAMGLAGPASAQCGGDFAVWLSGVRTEGRAAGVSEAALRLLDGLRPSPKVLALDSSQGVFAQTWLTFAGRMVNDHRLTVGRKHLAELADSFRRAEAAYGVPGPVIAAFWGLETDYGANQGRFDTLTALATLAHDCRRPELFRPQILDALRLVDRGNLRPKDLVGAWAGELGQLQLLPSDYLRFGTDGDGDGRVNLKADKPDVVWTAARYLADLGWRPGEPWIEEVRLPPELPWEQAGLDQRLPRRQWAAWGLKTPAGELEGDDLPAALLLPMGHRGPAFLAYPNFDVYLKWNRSLVYATTAAYLAARLAGAPEVRAGAPQTGLSVEQVERLQHRLTELGYDVGKADGVLGARTREAVRREQLRLGLPADAWPTPDLLTLLSDPGPL